MNNKRMIPLVVLSIALAACRGDRAQKTNDPNYEVVQEGAASGVTGTIHGPGETLPPNTSTNADTTTAFALTPSTAAPAMPPPGTVAGTLPSVPPPMTSATRPAPAYTPPPAGTPARQPAPQRPPEQQPTPEPEPAPTETVEEPPTTTDTVAPPPATTTTNPPPTTTTDPPPPTTTTEEPPPPPPGRTED